MNVAGSSTLESRFRDAGYTLDLDKNGNTETYTIEKTSK